MKRCIWASLSGHKFFSPLVSLGVAEKHLLWAPRESKAGMMQPVSTFDPVYRAMVDLLSVPLSAIPTEMWREERPPVTVFPGVAENVDLEAACPGLGLQLRHSLWLFTQVNFPHLSFLICKIRNRNRTSVTLGEQGLFCIIWYIYI